MVRIALIAVFLMFKTSVDGVSQDFAPSYETKSIFFGGGNWYVDPQQRQELYDWIDAVPDLHQYEIIIHSHTDNIGSKDYNAWLSQMRSESVLGILKEHEIPADWMFIRDFGEDHPDFDNGTFTGRLNNRRVDVVLIPPPT